MTEREEKVKATHDRMVAEQRDAMVRGGMRYDQAQRNAEKLMSESAEMLERRKREKQP